MSARASLAVAVPRFGELPAGNPAESARRLALTRELVGVIEDGRWVEINCVWEHVLGWSRDELLALSPIDLVHEDDRTALLAVCGEEAKPDAGVPQAEVRCRCKDGSYRSVLWSTSREGARLYTVGTYVAELGDPPPAPVGAHDAGRRHWLVCCASTALPGGCPSPGRHAFRPPRSRRSQSCPMDRLAEFAVVAVTPEDSALRSQPFAARVLAVSGRVAALEPVDGAATKWLPDDPTGVMMTFDHRRGLVALKGTLLRRPSGYLCFAVSDGIVIDRRRATRAAFQLAVTLCTSEHEAPGTTVNISATGMLVDTELAVGVGEKVGVAIDLGDDGAFAGPAHVTRRHGGLVGLHLGHNARAMQEALGAIVIERSRTVLQAR
jgi:PAS domain S-box-containing protein